MPRDILGWSKFCLTGTKLLNNTVMCMWVHVGFHQITSFLHTHLTLLAMNNSYFKLRTSAMDILFHDHKLMGLLVWHGLKIALLCSTQYRMRINDLTGFSSQN